MCELMLKYPEHNILSTTRNRTTPSRTKPHYTVPIYANPIPFAYDGKDTYICKSCHKEKRA